MSAMVSVAAEREETVRVLHVDDEPGLADVTATFLERERPEFGVVTAISAAEGLARLTEDIDAVISDYDMPGMDGIEFLEAVRDEYPDLPFVLYTGQGNEAIASDAIAAGVTDYLQKKPGVDQYTVLANRVANAVKTYRTERQLERVEAKYETVARLAADGFWEWDIETDTIRLSDSFRENFGFEHAVIEDGSEWAMGRIHPDDRERVTATVDETLDHARDRTENEYRFQHADGTYVPCLSRRWMLTDNDGTQPVMIGTLIDLSARKAQERELERVRDRFQAFTEYAADLITVVDDHGVIQYQSPSIERTLGYDQAALLGENVFEYFHPEDRDVLQESFTELLENPVDATDKMTYRFKHADGSWVWLESVGSNRTDSTTDAYVVTSRDVTDRMEREERVQQTTARLEALYENSPDMIDVLDPAGRLLDVNGRFCEELGYTEEELLGRPIWEIDVQVTDDDVNSLLADFELDERRRFEGVYERKDGSTFPVEVHLLRLNIEGADRFLAISREITERKAYERSLERQNEQLEEFAGLVSHDLRNPLNVAEGGLALARDDCTSEHLDAVDRAHDRMNALIDDLLNLAKHGEQVSETESVDLAELAGICWQNVETGDASIVAADAPTIQGDHSRVQQLLENLMRNAVKHAGEGITVTIGEIDGGFYVEDDGVGIPADDREAVFESGYSTTDEGTGFGLSIVKQIAEAHGWEIRVTEGTDGGARFEVTGTRAGR